jgi:oligopeptide/dipeptide ABC transporter ATP-binding protein
MNDASHDVVLSVRDLQTHFYTQRGVGKAVDGVSFDLHRGETLGLVGESGCGKSMTSLSIVGLYPRPAARIVGGQILFDGEDLVQLSPGELRRYRGKRLAMILQDPMSALNPVFTINNQLSEPLRLHQRLRGGGLRQRAIELLKLLRIPAPDQRLSSYPHQFSGGMRQRVVGAIGLSCSPEVLIADEPTTSLDVTVQAAYLALLKDIQRETDLAILFITHDFGVVARMCDRVAVMYAGRIVETDPTWELFDKPAHPYAEALLNSVPDVRTGTKRLYAIEGYPPSIYERPVGCPFASRCPYVMPHCKETYPPAVEIAPGHQTSCWRHV